MIVVLTGGTGGAKFVDGLSRVVTHEDLTIIVNTGDDHEWWGLYVSPDIDSIAYVLAGLLSNERGWGVSGDSFHCLQAMQTLGEPAWFSVGDRDIATHLLRTRLLTEGRTLTEATAEVCRRLGVPVRLMPMSDQRVETRVEVDGPDGLEDLGFQEYWVARQARDPVRRVTFAGIERARPAPGVLDAIRGAEGIVLCPSNPVVSVAPILAVPGVRSAIQNTACRTVAITPIIGGAPVRGLADAFVLDQIDQTQASDVAALGLAAIVAPTLMRTIEDAAALAKVALDALHTPGGAGR